MINIEPNELKKKTGQKLIDALNKGELQAFGECSYEDSKGKCCAIGYLLNKKERRIIRYKGWNRCAIGDILSRANFDPFLDRTGLSVEDADALQEAFDSGSDYFKVALEKITGVT